MKSDVDCNRRTGEKRTSELFVRIRTGAVLTIAVAVVLALSHIPYVINAAAAVLSIAGTYELLHAAKAVTAPRMFVLSLYAIGICFWEIPYYSVILGISWVTAVIAFSVLMKQIGKYHIASFCGILPCALMLPLFFRCIAGIRLGEYGLHFLIFVILGCLINDVAAYCVGKVLGKRKLAPTISPGKTLEGGIGGLAASTLLLVILSAAVSRRTGADIHYGFLILYLVLSSLVGQFGDLSMSVIKRSAGIKDFGKILPGHGGILDRFDSLLFVAPFAVLFSSIINGLVF